MIQPDTQSSRRPGPLDGTVALIAASAGLALMMAVPAAARSLTVESEVGFDQMTFEAGRQDLKPRQDYAVPAADRVQNIEPPPPPPEPTQPATGRGEILRSHHILPLNRILKEMIEANARLQQEQESIATELRALRGQYNIDRNRMNAVLVERDAYKQQIEKLSGLTDRYTQQLQALRSQMQQQQQQMDKRIEGLRGQLEQARAGIPPGTESERTADLQNRIQQLQQQLQSRQEEFQTREQAFEQQIKELRVQGDRAMADEDAPALAPRDPGGQQAALRRIRDRMADNWRALTGQPLPEDVQQALAAGGMTPTPAEDPDRAKKPQVTVTLESVVQDTTRGLEMIAMMEDLDERTQRLRSDEAKVHYNMGNIFFKKGDYGRAAEEYSRAVRLLPYDYNAHFNLALVSGEYLNDPRTALAHYREYLKLYPEAPDEPMVREKILSAQLSLESRIDSSLEKENQEHQQRLEQHSLRRGQ